MSRVLYPGLPSNSYFPRIQKLFGGEAGGVVTFELLAGAAAADIMFQVCFALNSSSYFVFAACCVIAACCVTLQRLMTVRMAPAVATLPKQRLAYSAICNTLVHVLLVLDCLISFKLNSWTAGSSAIILAWICKLGVVSTR